LATGLGQPVDAALAEAEQAIASAEKALVALDAVPLAKLTAAEDHLQESQSCVQRLEQQAQPFQAKVEIATLARDNAWTRVAQTRTQLDAFLQSVLPVDPAVALNAVCEARRELDEDLANASDLPTDLGQAEDVFERHNAELRNVEEQIIAARAQLEFVGGAVLKDQLEREREEHERLKVGAEELELELNGIKHLFEVLKETAAKNTAHLGKSLAKPVTEKFIELTEGRYPQFAFDKSLRIEHIAAEGGERGATALSVGTRDQLATLVRLALSAQLKTTVLLDDQLTQTGSVRLEWFKERLRASVRDHGHQIIVITCRPLDYLRHGELRNSSKWETEDGVAVIDLLRAISSVAVACKSNPSI
jgi:hypothetical protein